MEIKYKLWIYVLMIFAAVHVANAQVSGTSYGGIIDEVAVYDDITQLHGYIDGKTGLVKADVYININPSVAVIRTDDVKFLNSSANSCSSIGDKQKCSFAVNTNLAEGEYIETVSYTPVVGVSDSVSVRFFVDSQDPNLGFFRIRRSSPNEIEIKFDAEDGKTGGKCSGLAGLIVYNGPTIYHDEEFDFSTDVCTLTNHVVKLPLPDQSGTYDFAIEVYDRLGHRSNQGIQQLQIDVTAPVINSITLRAPDGTEMEELLVGRHDYIIRAEISETEFDTAAADLTSFGEGRDEVGNCEEIGSFNYWCEWNINPLLEPSPSTLGGLIKVNDTNRNSESKQFTFIVNTDASGPDIDEFYSGLGYTLFGNNPNELIVSFSDETGVDFDTVSADLRELNPTYGSSVKPDFCGDITCVWSGLVPGNNVNGEVEIIVVAYDIGGNRLQKVIKITVDRSLPNILRIAQNNDFPSGSPELAEDLVFSMFYSSFNGVSSSKLNANSIAPGVGEVEGVCDEVKCDFTISYEDLITQSAKGAVEFTLIDQAGNIATKLHDVTIFETSLDAPPQEVKVVVGEFSPKKLDRNLATLTPLKVFLPLNFIHAPNVFVRDAQINCRDLELFYPPQETAGYYLMANNAIATNILLDETNSQLSSIPFNCTITMQVGRDDVIYLQPEREQILTSSRKIPALELYNKRLGDIGTNTLEKILDVKDDVDFLDNDVFKTLRDIFGFAKRICEYMDILNQVYSIVETLKPIVYSIAQLVNTISGGGDVIWQGFLKAECNVRSWKEWAWPTDVYYEPIFGEDKLKDVGFFESLAGGSKSADEVVGKWDNGWVRRTCAAVQCSQCSNGFGLATEARQYVDDWLLQGVGLELPDVSVPGVGGTIPEEQLTAEEIAKLGSGEKKKEEKEEEGGGIKFTGGATVSKKDLDLGEFDKVRFEARLNPYDNIFVSAQCGCLPGIISNLEKLRQLKCKYGACLRDSAENALSTAACDALYDKDVCIWVIGGLPDILPITALLRSFMIDIRNFILDLPGRAIIVGKELLCKDALEAAYGPGFGDFTTWKGSAEACVAGVGDISITSPDNARQIFCGLLDATLLGLSWDQFRENELGFTQEDFWEFDKSGADMCEGVFDGLPTVPGESSQEPSVPSTPTSVPGGAG